MSTLALEARGLSKTYRTGFFMRKVEALSGLELAVEQGEIFGFVGPNGAGKTTTIKIFAGLHAATAGEARLFGVDIKDPRSRRRLGFLPERPYFYQHLSAREALRFYGDLCEMPVAESRRKADELIERVDLVRFADVPLRKYSKGMLQRVGLCQALLHDPDILILDEPMSGLDPMGRALVGQLIREEREAGKTVFFSSHILHDVETLSDRVAILVKGELKATGAVTELIPEGETLESVFLDEVERDRIDPKGLGVLA